MRPKLVNDFAFKYVFGADTIDSNNALKALLETFLERKVDKLQIRNPELTKNIEKMKDSRFDILVRFNDSVQVDIEMQVFVDIEELRDRLVLYCTKLHSTQELKGKMYSEADKSYVLAILNENYFEDDLFFHTVEMYVSETQKLFSDAIGIFIVELNKLDETKPKEEMSKKELMMYYFLHCQDKEINSKMKEIIEQNEVILMIDKRVDQIEEDRWKKLEDDFAKWDQNQREVKFQRKKEKLLREAKEDGLAQGRVEGIEQGIVQGRVEEQKSLIQTLSKSMSIEQIASALEKNVSEIEEILR